MKFMKCDLCDGVGERQPLRKTASKLSIKVVRVWRRLPSPLQNSIASYQVETGFSLATIPPCHGDACVVCGYLYSHD
jgi:hypothetical protein